MSTRSSSNRFQAFSVPVLVALGALAAVPNACGGRAEPLEPIDSQARDPTIVEACAALIACASERPFRSVSECVVVNSGQYMNPDPERVVIALRATLDTRSASIDCIRRARADCSAVRLCITTERGGDCAGLPASGGVCEGDRWVYCQAGTRNEIDCTTKDCEIALMCDAQPKAEGCVVLPDGSGECGAARCTDATFENRCEGDILVFCQGGVEKRRDCASGPGRSPRGCGARPDGSGMGCISLGAACSPESMRRCEGTDVVSCIDGREERRSCGALPIPMVCGTDDRCGLHGSCIACVPSPRLRCDPRNHRDTCSGSRLLYCDGQERELDCSAMGFAGCTDTAGGATCS